MQDRTLSKVWRILYPLLIYFLMDLLIVWGVQALASVPEDSSTAFIIHNSAALAAVIFLAVSIPVMYYIHKKDYEPWSKWIYKRPGYFALLVLIGALASHGLSAVVSLCIPDTIVGNYNEIQNTVFHASPVLVILQTVVLAPISEELLFRGIVYKRLEGIFGNFWAAGLISSAIFGIYHLNLTQGVFAFLFGLMACAVYDKTRNLWGSIALHAGGNLLSVIFVYAGFDYPNVGLYIAGMIISLAASWVLYHFLIRPIKNKAMEEAG